MEHSELRIGYIQAAAKGADLRYICPLAIQFQTNYIYWILFMIKRL